MDKDQEQEMAFAIAADAIVKEPRYSERWLSRKNIPSSLREATIGALNENSYLSDDEMVAGAIEALKASDQRDAQLAGQILEWARDNNDHRRRRSSVYRIR
jgi:hypothetical protein